MTKIIISIKKPEVKITDSMAYKAIKGIRMNNTEMGIIPAGEILNIEFKSRNKDSAWDAYHDFRKLYTESITQLDVNTGKKTVNIFSR